MIALISSAHDLLFYIFACVSTMYVIHIGLYLIGANIYDMWQFRRRSAWHAPHTELPQKDDTPMPLITIAVPAHNEEKVITRCLDSIRESTYPNIEVLVADDASRDRTKQLVRDYMLRYPTMQLQVYRMRRNVGKGQALSTVLRRYGHGTYAMMIDADSVIAPQAVANALSYFTDPTIAGVAANVQIMYDPTVLGILQKFEHMIGYRSKKLYTVLNAEFVVGGVASTYRMDVLRRVNFYDTDTKTEDIGLSIKIISLGNQAHRLVYGADVLAMTEGVMSFRALIKQRFRWKYGTFQNLIKYRHLICNPSRRYTKTLTFYRLPMAIVSEWILLTSPCAWAYAIYMALQQYSSHLIVGAYLTITVYTLIVIWFDENLRLTIRLRATAYAIAAYFVFYLMELVQFIAIIRCLIHLPALLRQERTDSTWTSPERSGETLVANEI